MFAIPTKSSFASTRGCVFEAIPEKSDNCRFSRHINSLVVIKLLAMRRCLRLVSSAALVALAAMSLAGHAAASARFALKVTVQPGLVVVVSEGDFEARSIGSYSVRVYSDPSACAGNETTFYAAGLVRARDGTVRSAETLVVPDRKRPLLMVVVQSAGSGGYLSADAFAVETRSVRLLASVSGLAPTEDPAIKLRRKLASAAR